MNRKAAPEVVAYEVGPRVERQAGFTAHRRTPGDPASRPLRIYTLDPSVSARLGGVATVHIPYERLQPGPAGMLFEVECRRPPPLVSSPLDLDRADVLMSSGLTPTPANGQYQRQMVYAVASVT